MKPTSGISSQLHSRAISTIPGGVDSNIRLDAPKVFFARGQGAWLWDVDGNAYVDYLLGQGPAFLGHAPVTVLEAVEKASRLGMVFGAQTSLEVEAAERLLGATRWPDMVRFGLTGTEMVQAALRLARAATGRSMVVRFEGHYHGWLDNVLVSVTDGVIGPASEGQLPSALRDSYVLPWNDIGALDSLFAEHPDDIAAVIMEPIMVNTGSVMPRSGYLEAVRALCDANGAILIFDEVITGFRVALGGAVEHLGVTPDLATYGKAMAGGWPVAALAGRRALMERFGTGRVNHSGTFNANVMSCAATIATIDALVADPPYARLEQLGTALMNGLAELGATAGIPLNVEGPPMAFHASIGEPAVAHDYRDSVRRDRARYAALARRLAAAGVWVAGRGIWYLSAAHGDREIEVALERVSAVLTESNA